MCAIAGPLIREKHSNKKPKLSVQQPSRSVKMEITLPALCRKANLQWFSAGKKFEQLLVFVFNCMSLGIFSLLELEHYESNFNQAYFYQK